MAITLERIKFYSPSPHSLPARPFKHTSGNPHTIIPHLSQRADSIPSFKSRFLLSSLSQIATPHSLPPRPPPTANSSHDSASALQNSPPSTSSSRTSSSMDCKGTYPNDFDRMLNDVVATAQGENDIEPPQTTEVLSSSFTMKAHVESYEDHTAPYTQSSPEPRDQPDHITTMASSKAVPIICALETVTTAFDRDNASSDTVTQPSAPGPPVAERATSDQVSHTEGAPHVSIESNASSAQDGSLKDSKPTAACQSADPINRSRSPSLGISRPPTSLVVIPTRRRSVSSHRSFKQMNSDPSLCSERIAEDALESDSAPSKDENNADYVDTTELREAGEYVRPSKRRKSPNKPSTASRETSLRLSSESPLTEQPQSLQEETIPESIPVQGFLRLRSIRSEVVYCLEFSQTPFASVFAEKQIGSSQSVEPQRTGRPTTKTPYSLQEDALLVELKDKNLNWDEIVDQFAQQFTYRKKSCLQAHYSSKLKRSGKQYKQINSKS